MYMQRNHNLKESANYEFIQDVVSLVKVEDEVELTHVSKIHVQCLYESMDDL